MASRFLNLALFLAVAVAAANLWAWAGRPVALPDVPDGRLRCLSYSPFSENELPSDPESRVPRQRIAEDLKLLSRYTGCVRTYSALHGLSAVAELAAANGMEVLLGIWIGSNHADNDREIEAALAAAAAHPQAVRGIVVGNEVLLRRELTADQLMDVIRTVRAGTALPVTYADVWEFWLRHPEMAALTDFVTVHILPFWEDEPIAVDHAQAHLGAILDKVRQGFAGKPILIGETGWPSAGRSREGAVPGPLNQARFVREFVVMAGERGMDYNLIEAFDQPWKRRNEGTVGGHWGIFDAQRNPKFALSGPVSDLPSWPLHALATTLLSAAFALWVRTTGRRLAPWRWAAVAALGHVAGAVFVFQIRNILAAGIGPAGLLLGLGGLALAAGGAAALLHRLTGDGRPARPATAPELAAWLRRPTAPGPELWLGALRLATLFGTASVALKLALDPRYLDFPTFAYALPAAAWLLLAPRERDTGERRPEEGWLAIVILLAVPVGLWREGVNLEAWAWNAIALAVAWPARRQAWREAARLVAPRRRVEAGGAEQP